MNRITLQMLIVAMVVMVFVIRPADAVEGEVSGVWVENQVMTGHCFVSSGDSLVIEPGVEIRSVSNFNFIVYGTLVAIGTEARPIRFYANGGRGAWGGVRFNGRSSNNSVMGYCEVSYCTRGILLENGTEARVYNCTIQQASWDGIRIEGSNGSVNDCDVTLVTRTGIVVVEGSRPTISKCRISRCDDHGISVGSGCTTIIEDNVISDVGDHGITVASTSIISGNLVLNCGDRGINLHEATRSVLTRNIVDNAQGGYGIEIYRANNVTLENNDIIGCRQTGIHIFSSNTIRLTNNIIASNGQYGLDVQEAFPYLSHNNLTGNTSGNYNGCEAGRDDISVSPMLGQDYIPLENSPMIDAGDEVIPLDPDGSLPDIGARFRNMNVPPVIVSYEPEDFELLDGGGEIEFSVEAEDANDQVPENNDPHPLLYSWFVNDFPEQQGEASSLTHLFEVDGEYCVLVIVDDGYYEGRTSHSWEFVVENAAAPPFETLPPTECRLSAPYPNPFNATARFELVTAVSGETRIRVMDIAGRQVSAIWIGDLSAGRHSFPIDATGIPTGEYVLFVETQTENFSRTLIVIK